MNAAFQVSACQCGSALVTDTGGPGTGIALLAGPRTKDGDELAMNKPRQHGVPGKCRFGNNKVLCSSSVLPTYLTQGNFRVENNY